MTGLPIVSREELGRENVVLRNLPYLKVPLKFREKNGSPVHYSEPKRVSQAETNDTIFLIYEFPKDKAGNVLKIEKKDKKKKAKR